LRRKHRDIYFWRGRGQIDFIIHEGSRIITCQVSWDGPKDRHTAALEEFKGEYPQADDGLFVSQGTLKKLLAG